MAESVKVHGGGCVGAKVGGLSRSGMGAFARVGGALWGTTSSRRAPLSTPQTEDDGEDL